MPERPDDLTVAVVDDEPTARRGMRRLVEQVPGFRVIGEAGSGDEALMLVREHAPDILLLDVELPGLNGFNVLGHLADGDRPTTIFVTAHDEHALRAFDVHAADYLLKPFTDRRFREALAVARRRHGSWPPADRGPVETRFGPGPGSEPQGTLALRHRGRVELVPTADIVWVEAEGIHARIHTASGMRRYRGSLDGLMARLDPERFVRVHRSAIVARAEIRLALRLASGGHEVVLTDGTRVRASRTGWRGVRQTLSDR